MYNVLFSILLLPLISQASHDVFETTEGPVKAIDQGRSIQVANIPYAQAPVDELRWKAPRPPLVRDVTWDGEKLGIVQCAQVGGPIAASAIEDFGKPVGSEDCLYLNITIPKAGAKNKPVFFWIHGGSNTSGYAQDELYEASKLAEKTDSIVVTVNYRLSHFGGLHHKAIRNDDPKDSSGNFATLDLIQALTWVKENIENFGGDPNRITAAGESAGCINVWGLILSPLAKGLFQRAFCASGFPQVARPAMGENAAKEFIEEALVYKEITSQKEASTYRLSMSAEETRDFLYSLSTEDILSLNVPDIPIQYISDGHVLPQGAITTNLSLGNYNKVPMMIGATKDEGTWFALKDHFKAEKLWKLINGYTSTEELENFIASPEYSDFESKANFLTQAFMAPINYASHILHFNPLVPIYRYKVEWTAQTRPWNKIFGAAHAFDLPMIFNKTKFEGDHFMRYLEPTLITDENQAVSDEFLQSLKGFIHAGNPNEYSNNYWPQWYPSLQFYMPWQMVIDNKGMSAKPASAFSRVLSSFMDTSKFLGRTICDKLFISKAFL